MVLVFSQVNINRKKKVIVFHKTVLWHKQNINYFRDFWYLHTIIVNASLREPTQQNYILKTLLPIIVKSPLYYTKTLRKLSKRTFRTFSTINLSTIVIGYYQPLHSITHLQKITPLYNTKKITENTTTYILRERAQINKKLLTNTCDFLFFTPKQISTLFNYRHKMYNRQN